MANDQNDMGRNGNGLSAFIIRGVGVFIMGAAVSTTGWMYWKFENATAERNDLAKEIAILKTSVEKFHTAFYRWQDKTERANEARFKELRGKPRRD